MSMRPKRAFAASTMAASVASLVTSASKATHSAPPPDWRAIATVSSAEARLLSTAMTLAPSWAKRSTVARPLPMPSPGDCPAPTTMATLSLRRMANLAEKGAIIHTPGQTVPRWNVVPNEPKRGTASWSNMRFVARRREARVKLAIAISLLAAAAVFNPGSPPAHATDMVDYRANHYQGDCRVVEVQTT